MKSSLPPLFRLAFLKTVDPCGPRVGILPINSLEGLIDSARKMAAGLPSNF